MKVKILLLLAIPFALSISQNLLQNPGFESWVVNMPEHWSKGDSNELFQEDVIVYSGNFSVKDSFWSTTAGDAELYQGMYAQPNTIYRISFWAYDNDPAGRARAGVQWFSNGSYVSSEWPFQYTVDSAAWQLWTYDLPPSPSNADSVRFVIRGYDVDPPWTGSAIFYVDEAYCGPPATQPPTILRSWHTPTNPGASTLSEVYIYALDNGTIDFDTLFYGVNDLGSPATLTHVSVTNDTFYYEIPGQSAGDTVFYYIKLVDNDGLTAVSDTGAYYVGAMNVSINELYYDTPGADSGCFTEVYGLGMMSLDGFALVGVNGNGGVDYATIDLTGHTIPGDGFFVIGDNSAVPNVDLVDSLANFQNGDDNLELRFNGITIDALGYGELNGWVFTGEWLPAADVMNGHSLGRYPDGSDTDNNFVDFNDYDVTTPGAANPAVGVAEYKGIADPLPLPMIANPIRPGMRYRALLGDLRYYPLSIYNAVGQRIEEVIQPAKEVRLPTGIYFLRPANVASCLKVIVLK